MPSDLLLFRVAAVLAATFVFGAGAGAARAEPGRLLTPTHVCVPEFNHPLGPLGGYVCWPRPRGRR